MAGDSEYLVTSRARGIETADLGRMPEIGRSIFEFGASQRRIEGRSPETSAAFPHPDRIGHTRCELDHRAMCSSILGCRHVPDSGEEDVSSFGSSGAEHFDGMAQECVRWLPGCIGPRVVADPGSVTTVTRLTLILASFICFNGTWVPVPPLADIPPPPARDCAAEFATSGTAQQRVGTPLGQWSV